MNVIFTPTGSNLVDHCSDEARFIIRFPKCMLDCQQLARRYFPVITK